MMFSRANLARSALYTTPPLAALALLTRLPSPWTSWRPATCMPAACFCEALRDSLVRQPVNAATSMAFLMVCFMVLGTVTQGAATTSSGSAAIRRSMVYPMLYAGALAVIGLGSAFYHASLTFTGQTIDVLGMYLLGTFILLFGLFRGRDIRPAIVLLSYLTLNGALLAALVLHPELRRYAFGIIVILAFVVEWRARKAGRAVGDARNLWAAAAVLTVAFGIWVADLTGAACNPSSPLQGHGVWHVLGAIAAALVYSYYLSESGVSSARAADPTLE